MSETTFICILVNTKSINNKNKNNQVFIFDNHGELEQFGHPHEYVSTVYKNSPVVWSAGPFWFEKNPGTVTIEKIEKKSHDGGADILTKRDNRKGSDGLVTGNVVDNYIAGVEYYSIYLNVNGKQYIIDPQLQMHDD